MLLSNKNYRAICLIYALLHAIPTSVASILSQLTSPYGFKASDNSIFGAVTMILGIPSAIVFGKLIDHRSNYNKVCKSVCIAIAFA